jgi:shikimate kinase
MSSCQEDGHAGHDPAEPRMPPRIFLVGVACVGKTTIGAALAELIGYRFYDLDSEVEAHYQIAIEPLQQHYRSMDDFRRAAAEVLQHLLSDPQSHHCVVALPPSGLLGAYWNVVLSARTTTVVIQDKPENILRRTVFLTPPLVR